MNGEIMNFVKSDSMKISVSKEQEKQLSSKETILQGIKDNKVIAFDIFDDSELIGFAMIREFERGCFFLWDFAIDSKFQNKGLGEKALTELLLFMKKNYSIEIIPFTLRETITPSIFMKSLVLREQMLSMSLIVKR